MSLFFDSLAQGIKIYYFYEGNSLCIILGIMVFDTREK